MRHITTWTRIAILSLASGLGACTEMNACGSAGRLAWHEYRFVNTRGEPVPGVAMRVVDSDGEAVESKPVPEFAEGRAPTSDTDGLLTFHSLPRFSARDTTYFGPIPIWQEKFGTNPMLIFELESRVVRRIKLDDTPRGKEVRISREAWEARPRPITPGRAVEDIEVIQRTFRVPDSRVP